MKRKACEHAQLFGPLSKRRASVLVGLHRSTLYYHTKQKDDTSLRERMRELAARHRRWGSPQLHYILKREGLVVNHKRTERIYIEEKLSLRTKRRKKRPSLRIEMPPATAPNQVWAMDFMSDRLSEGRKLKAFTLIDEYTKEVLALELDTSINGQNVTQILERVSFLRGCPQAIRTDNGPEFTSKALFLWTDNHKVNHIFIEPGKPTQNPFIESFNDKFRNEFLNEHWFNTIKEARELALEWLKIYNEFRPHSTLNGLTPCAFAQAYFKEQIQQKTAPKTLLMVGP